MRLLLFQTIHDVALMLDRERVGRAASPTGGVLDSQSVKAPAAKERGPVAIFITLTAAPITSAGRFWPLGPLGT